MDNLEQEFIDEVLEYLDLLRETGVTNMYGAAPYIVDEFNVDKYTARKLLGHWMKTFSKRHKEED